MARFSVITLALAAAASLVYGQDKTGACKALAKVYPDETEFPGTSDYQTLSSYWVSNVRREPHCIFAPRNAKAAAFAIKTFQRYKTTFAIGSGGHSTNVGFSSTSDGILLSLRRLNSVEVNLKAGTAKLGPGGTWGNVYEQLEKYGQTAAGGRASPVGVGGFTLGGGLSFYLYDVGFGADTVVQYEVVTAAGEILKVNKSSHPDLFLALKGSGAPFCLVTSITYKTIPVPKGVYGGAFISGPKSIPPVLEAVGDFVAPGGGTTDKKAHLITMLLMSMNNGSTQPDGVPSLDRLVSNTLFYSDPVQSVPEVYKGIEKAARTEFYTYDFTSPRTISNMTSEANEFVAPNPDTTRATLVPYAIRNPTAKVLKGVEKIWTETWEPVLRSRKIEGLAASLLFIPMGKPAARGGGKNVLGIARDSELIQMALTISWKNAKDDAEVRRIGKREYEKQVAYLKSVGHHEPWMRVLPMRER